MQAPNPNQSIDYLFNLLYLHLITPWRNLHNDCFEVFMTFFTLKSVPKNFRFSPAKRHEICLFAFFFDMHLLCFHNFGSCTSFTSSALQSSINFYHGEICWPRYPQRRPWRLGRPEEDRWIRTRCWVCRHEVVSLATAQDTNEKSHSNNWIFWHGHSLFS